MAAEIVELRDLGQERFCAVLSNGMEIRVSTAMIADFSLYSGRELDDRALEQLRRTSGFTKCRDRALRIVGLRPLSCKELYDRLIEKGEDPDFAREAVEWLLERRFLDDKQYAATLVRHYAAKGYGAQRVKNELYRRGIAKSLWDEALLELPESENTVYRLLCNKLGDEIPDRAEAKRATDALYRRGYSWDEIKGAMNRFRAEHSDN